MTQATTPTPDEQKAFIKAQDVAYGELEAVFKAEAAKIDATDTAALMALQRAQRKTRAEFIQKQKEEYQAFQDPQAASKAATTGAKPDAEKAGESFGQGILDTGSAMVDGLKSMLGFGEEAVESATDGTAPDKLSDAGKATGKGIAGFFKNMNWKKAGGMLLGGIAAWLASSMVGGGMIGTIIFMLLAVPFALMGGDFMGKMFGGGKSADKPETQLAARAPAVDLAQGTQIPGPIGPGFAQGAQTTIGAAPAATNAKAEMDQAWLATILGEQTPRLPVQTASYDSPSAQPPYAPSAAQQPAVRLP